MIRILAVAAALAIGTGCVTKYTPVVNTVDASAVDWSKLKKLKQKEECRTMLFGSLPIGGTASMVNALRRAKITKLYAVDRTVKNYILFTKDCVVVYGK